jgi:hypothetical protein
LIGGYRTALKDACGFRDDGDVVSWPPKFKMKSVGFGFRYGEIARRSETGKNEGEALS